MKLIIVGGVSGAGKSSALRTLADLGFYVVDNLPVPLLKEFIELAGATPKRYAKTALAPDIHDPAMLGQFLSLLQSIRALSTLRNQKPELLFLDADTPTILRRYSESRRPHPIFDQQKDKSLEDAVQRERSFLIAFKEIATRIIDTSQKTVHELRREVESFCTELLGEKRGFRVHVQSFGYKFGTPSDCDLIVDVRFLPNPHFQPELRPKCGLDVEVAQFVLEQPDTQVFLKQYGDLLGFLIPRYQHEGKAYLAIGVGCTGGRHRSVTLACAIAELLQKLGITVRLQHRDVERI
jgi:UPF0042 nucleotide-binding protein